MWPLAEIPGVKQQVEMNLYYIPRTVIFSSSLTKTPVVKTSAALTKNIGLKNIGFSKQPLYRTVQYKLSIILFWDSLMCFEFYQMKK